MHLRSLKLICPMVKEEMHLQENTLYDLDLDLVLKVTQNVVQCPPNHMTYVPAKFEVATSNSLGEDGFTKLYDLDLGVKVTQNVAQYHPHHVTYAPVNFEVAMSNGSGEDSFTRKYII